MPSSRHRPCTEWRTTSSVLSICMDRRRHDGEPSALASSPRSRRPPGLVEQGAAGLQRHSYANRFAECGLHPLLSPCPQAPSDRLEVNRVENGLPRQLSKLDKEHRACRSHCRMSRRSPDRASTGDLQAVDELLADCGCRDLAPHVGPSAPAGRNAKEQDPTDR